MQRRKLGMLVYGGIQVLKRTTAAGLEMAAARGRAPGSSGEPLDHPTFPPAIPAGR
jgi:hypothetical protein